MFHRSSTSKWWHKILLKQFKKGNSSKGLPYEAPPAGRIRHPGCINTAAIAMCHRKRNYVFFRVFI